MSNRRDFLEIAAWGAANFAAVFAASAGEAFTSSPGDGGFARQAGPLPPGDAVVYHDPRALADFPEFRFALDATIPHVASGGWVKEVSTRQLPIARGIAGVHAFLDPGASRELHWHATAAEWAIVLDGRCQTVVIEPSGVSEINNFESGDLWYFAKGHGHAIQTIGDKPCNLLLAFDDGGFSPDISAFSITDWIDLTPRDLLAQEFGVPKDLFDAFPKGETFIQAGPILKPEDALEAPWPRESTHKFRLLRDQKAVREFDGGSLRIATSDVFPASKTISGGVLTLKPGAMRKLHWNVSANEFQYFLRGRGQVAMFGSGGRGKVAEFSPGDVAYIPMGFGHAIRNVGDEDLEVVLTWDNGALEEIDLDKWVQASPSALLANNFAGVPASTLEIMKKPSPPG
jgi:oxalate decarboxylase